MILPTWLVGLAFGTIGLLLAGVAILYRAWVESEADSMNARAVVKMLDDELTTERERVADLHSRLASRSHYEYASSKPFIEHESPAEPDEEPGRFVVDDTGLIDGWFDPDESDG